MLGNAKRWCLWTMVLASLASLSLSAAGAGRSVPDFGLILNDDGDFSITDMDPRKSAENLTAMIQLLKSTPVRTLAYSVGAGSDIMYYPTQVANVWGWRDMPEYATGVWGERISKAKAAAQAQVDSVRIAGLAAKKLGLYFIPSYRMNDSHFIGKPLVYPLTGEFWLKNQDKTIGKSPVRGYDYSNLLDYSRPEVRAYRRDILFEIIERYQDVMDGLELDFNRVQIFFPPGTAQARAHLMTELVEQVRQRLTDIGAANGRSYSLFVRVPPALKNCRWSGLEVEAWMKRRLVDVVIPSQLMTLAHCMPMDEFVSIGAASGCRVYASIYPRTQYMWPFVTSPSAKTYSGGAGRSASVELIRGAAANYWQMGVDGFQLFNFNLPFNQGHELVPQALSNPAAMVGKSRIHALTAAYFHDREDTYQYRKQVPRELQPDTASSFTLLVGTDLTAPETPKPDYCGLRLGFVGKVTKQQRIVVTLNGKTLKAGRMGWRLLPTTGKRKGGKSHPTVAQAYLHLQIAHPHDILRRGENTVTITLKSSPTETVPLTLVEMQLGILYTDH
ncbi:MAG: hypothetical protein KAI66_03165 [Lentisphaeria bacterium]|nr:hypothetical protein [Lentisphaeria bacterium]